MPWDQASYKKPRTPRKKKAKKPTAKPKKAKKKAKKKAPKKAAKKVTKKVAKKRPAKKARVTKKATPKKKKKVAKKPEGKKCRKCGYERGHQLTYTTSGAVIPCPSGGHGQHDPGPSVEVLKARREREARRKKEAKAAKAKEAELKKWRKIKKPKVKKVSKREALAGSYDRKPKTQYEKHSYVQPKYAAGRKAEWDPKAQAWTDPGYPWIPQDMFWDGTWYTSDAMAAVAAQVDPWPEPGSWGPKLPRSMHDYYRDRGKPLKALAGKPTRGRLVCVEPSRLNHGTWGGPQGDIVATYSADTISVYGNKPSRIRGHFLLDGKKYVYTGGGGGYYSASELVERKKWKGKTRKYGSDRFPRKGFYYGIPVQHKHENFVLGKEIEIRAWDNPYCPGAKRYWKNPHEVYIPRGFAIERLDQGGGYVTPPGSSRSYTPNALHARIFPTEAAAERELCSNERVVYLT
jgi:hypothetical protein